jgi:hypothetical protein
MLLRPDGIVSPCFTGNEILDPARVNILSSFVENLVMMSG